MHINMDDTSISEQQIRRQEAYNHQARMFAVTNTRVSQADRSTSEQHTANMAVFDKRFDRDQPIQAAPRIINQAPKRTAMDDIGISFFNDEKPQETVKSEHKSNSIMADLGINFFQ